MTLFEMKEKVFRPISEASLSEMNVRERGDLQRLLRTQIEVIDADLYILAEEFSDWEDSRRRIDLLAIDKNGNLVVIELKRTQDGGHMELQAIRYASMVSAMTFERAVNIHKRFLKEIGQEAAEAQTRILEFLEWDEPDEESFAVDVRIILVSEDFSKELTTAVLWLRDRDIDIRCVRLQPYHDEGKKIIDVQQIIPLPEAEDYQVQLKEKEQRRRSKRAGKQWDQDRFMARLEQEKGKQAKMVAQSILEWVTPKVSYVWYGTGSKEGGIVPVIRYEKTDYQIFRMGTRGKFVFRFDWLLKKKPFDKESVRMDLLTKINKIPGVSAEKNVITKRVRIPLDMLASSQEMTELKEAISWLIGQIPKS